jgi:hypothetical protein
MTYELWHLTGGSMIDCVGEQDEALEAVRAYLDADEANDVVLFVRDASGKVLASPTGDELVEWAARLSAAS